MSFFDHRPEKSTPFKDELPPNTPRIIDLSSIARVIIGRDRASFNPAKVPSDTARVYLPDSLSLGLNISIRSPIDELPQITNHGEIPIILTPDSSHPKETITLLPEQLHRWGNQTLPSCSFIWKNPQGELMQLTYTEEVHVDSDKFANTAVISYEKFKSAVKAPAA